MCTWSTNVQNRFKFLFRAYILCEYSSKCFCIFVEMQEKQVCSEIMRVCDPNIDTFNDDSSALFLDLEGAKLEVELTSNNVIDHVQ